MYQYAIHSSISNHETFSMEISEFHYSSSSVAQGILSPCSSQLRLKMNTIQKFCLCPLLAETRKPIGVFSIVQISLWMENWCKMFCVYTQTAFYILANKKMVLGVIKWFVLYVRVELSQHWLLPKNQNLKNWYLWLQ